VCKIAGDSISQAKMIEVIGIGDHERVFEIAKSQIAQTIIAIRQAIVKMAKRILLFSIILLMNRNLSLLNYNTFCLLVVVW